MTNNRPRAHFLGAPFFVPSNTKTPEDKFAATGFNTGNLLIGDAVARLLDVNLVSTGNVVNFPALEESVDLIVIPSANFLSPVMDMSWLLPLIERTRHQILMVGVGAQFPTTRLSEAKLPDTTVRLMQLISERSTSISVRGQFTADVLKKYGVHNTQVTGCPSLFRTGKETLSIKKPDLHSLKPAFNGSSNVIGHALSEDDSRKVELKLLQLAMRFEAPYILQNEVPEIQISAGLDDGIAGCRTTLQELKTKLSIDEYCGYMRRHAKTFFDVNEWTNFISNFDIVVGSRFHGNIIALSQGIPAAFIAHDSRTIELCETLQIPRIGLKQFYEMKLESVIEELDFSKLEHNFPNARANLANFFAENQVPHRLHQATEHSIVEAYHGIIENFTTELTELAVSQITDPLEQMTLYIRQNNLQSAKNSYEAMEESHPKFIGATLLLAEALVTDNPELALLLSKKVIHADIGNTKSYWVGVLALRQSKAFDEADDLAREGIENGRDPAWQSELGKMLSSELSK